MSSARETAEKVWQKICEERGLYDAGVNAITAAILAERAACAKVVEWFADNWDFDSRDLAILSAAIRARP